MKIYSNFTIQIYLQLSAMKRIVTFSVVSFMLTGCFSDAISSMAEVQTFDPAYKGRSVFGCYIDGFQVESTGVNGSIKNDTLYVKASAAFVLKVPVEEVWSGNKTDNADMEYYYSIPDNGSSRVIQADVSRTEVVIRHQSDTLIMGFFAFYGLKLNDGGEMVPFAATDGNFNVRL